MQWKIRIGFSKWFSFRAAQGSVAEYLFKDASAAEKRERAIWETQDRVLKLVAHLQNVKENEEKGIEKGTAEEIANEFFRTKRRSRLSSEQSPGEKWYC